MLRVLMIDDDGQITQLTELKGQLVENVHLRVLRYMGSNTFVDVATRESVGILNIWKEFDIILLDFNMIDTNGDEVLERWIDEGINLDDVRVIGTSLDTTQWKSPIREHMDKIHINRFLDELNKE